MAILKPYNNPDFFRFWAQTVLPTLYDDSLSYYEVLSKLVKWVNNTIQQLEITQENLNTVNAALEALTVEVHTLEGRVDVAEADIDALEADLKATKDRVTAAEKRLDVVVAKNTQQDDRMTAIETKDAEQDKLITAIQELDAAQNVRLNDIELKNSQQDTTIAAAQADATKALSDAAKAQQTADSAASTAALAASAAQEAKASASTASQTAGEAMTEAATAKSTADGVDAKATEALDKANSALASAGGDIVWYPPIPSYALNFMASGGNTRIQWWKQLKLLYAGRVIGPSSSLINIDTPESTGALVMLKTATEISNDTVKVISDPATMEDTYIPLFTFNTKAPGFMFGQACSFPLPYKVNGVSILSATPRFYSTTADLSNNLSGGTSLGTAIAAANITYAPPGSLCIITGGGTLYASILSCPVHVELAAGTWKTTALYSINWLSLKAYSGEPVFDNGDTGLDFVHADVSGINFKTLGNSTFRNAYNCKFGAAQITTLNNCEMENCTFTGAGQFVTSVILKNCTFEMGADSWAWTLENCTCYDCIITSAILRNSNTFYGGYIHPQTLTGSVVATFHNATLDFDMAGATVPPTGLIGCDLSIINCFLFALDLPVAIIDHATVTGSGVSAVSNISPNVTPQFAASKFLG